MKNPETANKTSDKAMRAQTNYKLCGVNQH
jgi:hypothetical protein